MGVVVLKDFCLSCASELLLDCHREGKQVLVEYRDGSTDCECGLPSMYGMEVVES